MRVEGRKYGPSLPRLYWFPDGWCYKIFIVYRPGTSERRSVQKMNQTLHGVFFYFEFWVDRLPAQVIRGLRWTYRQRKDPRSPCSDLYSSYFGCFLFGSESVVPCATYLNISPVWNGCVASAIHTVVEHIVSVQAFLGPTMILLSIIQSN